MAESKITRHTPTLLSSSEYTFTPASGYSWDGFQILELQPDVFYVHFNITGNYSKNSVTDVGEFHIRGRSPYSNLLHCKISSSTALAQWLTGSMVRIFYDSGDALTGATAFVNGVVVLS